MIEYGMMTVLYNRICERNRKDLLWLRFFLH
nr:MAG TPA: hypothetical protein [Caudoviricetes sp.]